MSTSDEEEDLRTLEADLRRALQHQQAEYERVRELQREIEALMERARRLLERSAAEDGRAAEDPRAADDGR